MEKKNSRFEFVTLLTFLVAGALLLTNGFVPRIAAQEKGVDVYRKIEPVGVVLDTILDEYVRDADIDRVVEGALIGMMSSLDRHSSFIPAEALDAMREDTKGEFEGIGVSIKMNDDEQVMVFTPISGSPAADVGIRPFDVIVKIDDIDVTDLWTEGMTSNERLGAVADKIRGPRGTSVKLTISRRSKESEEPLLLDFSVKRAKVPLESIKESRIVEGNIGYVRVSDFKDNTASDLRNKIKSFLDEGMQAFVLDLRWNPGGLLSASKEACELFLPKNSLVTYTKGRPTEEGKANPEDMELFTERRPVLPPAFPVVILVNDQTASSSEIVTGALQYYQRAIIVGEKTFGKGSVQTIIPLKRPAATALRLTTALYYTPADVTIDHQGILPDVEVEMTLDQERALGIQMYQSYEDDPAMMDQQNHGSVTGDAVTEETVEDVQFLRAVEILREEPVWENLLAKYHRDVHETQVAADEETVNGLDPVERELLAPARDIPLESTPEILRDEDSGDAPGEENAPAAPEAAPAP